MGEWNAAAVEREGWVKVGGRASSRYYLLLLLVPLCLRTPLPQSSPALRPKPSFGSTLHSRTLSYS